MRLVYLTECGQSGTRLGRFLEAVMRDFKPEQFVVSIGRLEHNLGLSRRECSFTDHRYQEVLKYFRELESQERACGLNSSANGTKAYINTLLTNRSEAWNRLDEAVRIARQNLENEMKTLCYLEITPSDIHLWTCETPFGEDVARKFPRAKDDIEQAAKALAVERGQASVYHLMGAMDIAFQRLCKKLGAKCGSAPTWDEMLKAIVPKIDAMPTANNNARLRKERFQSIHANLLAVKRAWRNPVMHGRSKHTIDQARDIFQAVGGFMRDLAKVI